MNLASIKEFCTNQGLSPLEAYLKKKIEKEKKKNRVGTKEEESTLSLFQPRITLGLVAFPHTAQAWLKNLHPQLPVARTASSGPPGEFIPAAGTAPEAQIRAGHGTRREARSGAGDLRPTRPPAGPPAPLPGGGVA